MQDARLALAKARWQTGDRETARRLATLARDVLGTMGPALADKTRAADVWLSRFGSSSAVGISVGSEH